MIRHIRGHSNRHGQSENYFKAGDKIRTKARDGDFIEFKLILMEFFKNFDQNSN